MQPAYNALQGKPEPNKRTTFDGSQDQNHIYYLKSYRIDSGHEWRREVEAYTALYKKFGSTNGTLACRAHYQHDQTLNLILDYVERSSLESFMEIIRPPTISAEIADFWGSMYPLFDMMAKMEMNDPEALLSNHNSRLVFIPLRIELHTDSPVLAGISTSAQITFGYALGQISPCINLV